MDKEPGIASLARDDNSDSLREAPVAERRRKNLRRSPGKTKTTAIDLSLFSIPLSRVAPDKCYEVWLNCKRSWKRAVLSENAWIAKGHILGRVEDTVDVRIPEREVTATIDWLANTMAKLLEDEPDAGARQYYIDRDVLDGVYELLGDTNFDHPIAQEISIARAIRLAAAAKAMPSVPHSEIAVCYRVTDDADNTMFDSFNLEDALLYICGNRDVCRKDVGVVFADGSVRYGHELSRRPWIAAPDDFPPRSSD